MCPHDTIAWPGAVQAADGGVMGPRSPGKRAQAVGTLMDSQGHTGALSLVQGSEPVSARALRVKGRLLMEKHLTVRRCGEGVGSRWSSGIRLVSYPPHPSHLLENQSPNAFAVPNRPIPCPAQALRRCVRRGRRASYLGKAVPKAPTAPHAAPHPSRRGSPSCGGPRCGTVGRPCPNAVQAAEGRVSFSVICRCVPA
jgi:hypothetical protein